MEIPLKYGLNPNQGFARLVSERDPAPLTVLNGKPSFINILDGLRGWQLVRDMKTATAKPSAASYKHVSPAGAAVAGELTETFRQAFLIEQTDLSPIATAYAKARSSDRVASFGDFVSVSETVDASLAQLLKREVSDGIIAPGYDNDALEILKGKKSGGYVILQIDPNYQPPETEVRTEFGLKLEQSYNDAAIDRELLTRNIVTDKKDIPEDVLDTLLVVTIALKHTQSNSVAVGWQGQAIGIGAGQQSRIACTRLACEKFERWLLMHHPKALSLPIPENAGRPERGNLIDEFVRWHEMDEPEQQALAARFAGPVDPITRDERRQWVQSFEGVALSSDAFFPFRDNIDRAAISGVKYVAQAGGSKRDQDVIDAANEHGMVMAMTGLRLFLH
ncbi:MAG: phosphoribosylaminoimidazolecarboxamide formyltransferase [Phycisphaeraceae bacterium]